MIEVQNRELVEIRFLGVRLFKYYTSWASVRIMAARTYENLLDNLRKEPEFLETEVIVAGYLEPAYP